LQAYQQLSMTSLSIGISPCPNDTFMFEALVNNRLESGGLSLDFQFHDVEKLNLLVREGKADISKISFSNYPSISNDYEILDAGSALGNGCGPLLISKNEYALSKVKDLKIAIPGRYTTANLLLSIFFPMAEKKGELLFSDIEESVLSGRFDAGLIIHESRFTYASRGLKKIADMGELWEKTTGMPLPLGCIVIRRTIPIEIKRQVNSLIRESIQAAFNDRKRAMPFVKDYAREMDEMVMQQHIDLYVNKFSLDLGTEGKKAIELMFRKGKEHGLIPSIMNSVFMSEQDNNNGN
jgi:1,4-dihydroxy-6-naphthoate synthase